MTFDIWTPPPLPVSWLYFFFSFLGMLVFQELNELVDTVSARLPFQVNQFNFHQGTTEPDIICCSSAPKVSNSNMN